MSTSSISLLTGQLKQLDAKTQADESVTSDDASDTTKLARYLTRLLGAVAALQRRYNPNVITFRDIATTGTSSTPVTVTLTHKFNGAVDWWIVRHRNYSTTTSPIFVETANDGQTLTLLCYGTSTFDLRLQEAG